MKRVLCFCYTDTDILRNFELFYVSFENISFISLSVKGCNVYANICSALMASEHGGSLIVSYLMEFSGRTYFQSSILRSSHLKGGVFILPNVE